VGKGGRAQRITAAEAGGGEEDAAPTFARPLLPGSNPLRSCIPIATTGRCCCEERGCRQRTRMLGQKRRQQVSSSLLQQGLKPSVHAHNWPMRPAPPPSTNSTHSFTHPYTHTHTRSYPYIHTRAHTLTQLQNQSRCPLSPPPAIPTAPYRMQLLSREALPEDDLILHGCECLMRVGLMCHRGAAYTETGRNTMTPPNRPRKHALA